MSTNPFDIVKDSTIWRNSSNFSAVTYKDPYIRMGIVKKVYRDTATTDLRYLVEVRDMNDAIELNCRLMRKFGGVYNYEDTVLHGYKFDDKPDPVQDFEAKGGDIVLVACLGGEAREGVIIGSMMHPARKSDIDITKGPQYKSEFNGVETKINESGEYIVTFKAVPTNASGLDNKPSKVLPAPTYDTKVGGSYFTFDKTGSFEVNDKDQNGIQNLRIDKPKGTITINSGKIKFTMTKSSELVELKCKDLMITADNSIVGKTKELNIDATTSASVKSPKVAIGKDGIELLDQLFHLIENLGKVIPISPVGPCTALVTTPQWNAVAQVQSKIKEITGTF